MCGIVGILSLNGDTIDPDLLDAMTDALTHRGPDGRGTYRDDGIGLGHRRLSILDLSDAAQQPMQSDDGRYVLTYNGEIYNFQQKRKELEAKGYRFQSTGDTEVLLKLYEEYGKQCLEHLRGMFAFALYDRQERTVFLARDRFGKKPLKYFHRNGIFAFASEQKALELHPSCPRDIDWEAIHHFLTVTYLPAPRTGIQGMNKLPAGHCMTLNLETGACTQERYFALQHAPDHTKSIDEWNEEILDRIQESTQLRMISDVPLGAFLSGGIDSACIVGLMSQLSSHPVETFSIGTESATSELPDADRIAQMFGTNHHPITVEPDIVQLLPELVHTYEEPFGDPSVIPTYLVSRFTRQSVTVALSGDGGDENFGGYLRYPLLNVGHRYGRIPHWMRSPVRGATALLHTRCNNTFTYRCLTFQDSLDRPWHQRALQYMGAFGHEEKCSLYTEQHSNAFTRSDDWFSGITHDARGRSDDYLHQAMNMDIETYLPDDLMPKVDLGAMAHGLEVRAPLLDHTLMEYTAQLPAHLQVRGWQTKWIMKHMLRDLLPPETLTKRKQGFRLPLNAWFRGDLQPWVQERLLEGHPLFWELFSREKVEQYLHRYFSSHIDYAPQVWMLLWLQEWFLQRDAIHT